MTDKETPLALRLADQLEAEAGGILLAFIPGQAVQEKEMDCNFEAAAELRRLHSLNIDMLNALERLLNRDEADSVEYTGDHPVAKAREMVSAARNILVKAKEQNHD